MTDGIIKPQTLRGFRDYLPEAMLPRERLMETARQVYRSFGYSPIDTPALEYSEILLGKGGAESDKQLFRFTDQGGRDVAMRFDLTVPLARFTAQHLTELGTPFKRYHIAPVWRAERPQRGRFREFYQCDFDTIGTTSNAADVETALVIHELFRALGFERFSIRVNHRALLNGYLEKLGLADNATAVLRCLDKLHKIGAEAVIEEMTREKIATAGQAQSILDLASIQGDNDSVLAALDALIAGSESGEHGAGCLRELFGLAKALGIDAGRLRLDPSIARGLDYYTGTVYETLLDDLPGIGSVCSGGRYDNLAGLYTKQPLPGVGASLGLDRLLDAMGELGMHTKRTAPAPVLVVFFLADRLGDYLGLAQRLRAGGIGAELYPEPKPIGRQLKYADRRGFRVAVIAGDDEFARGVWQVKDLATAESIEVSDEAVVARAGAIAER
jgi:histidyl-tRNA synthetase